MPAVAQKIPAMPPEIRVAKDYANWHLADLRVSADVRFAPEAVDHDGRLNEIRAHQLLS
jgi:hypothetical protein